MQIKITKDVPLQPKHGITLGRVFEVVETKKEAGRGKPYWTIISDTGDEIGIFGREAEIVKSN